MRHEIRTNVTASAALHNTSRFCAKAALLLASPLFALSLHAQAAGGSIAGTVSGQGGTPIADAAVLYGKLVPAAKSAVPMMSPPVLSVYSGPGGSFSIPGLAPATYLLCVQVAGGGYLDPCHWSTTPTTVAVATGQAVSGISVHVAKGARLTIPVLDPQKLVASNAAATGTATVPSPRIGVMAISGALIPAELTTSTTVGKTYTITLPFDSATGVLVSGGGYQVTATGASAIPSGGQTIQVTAPSTGPLPNLSFTVTGLAATAAPPH